MLRADGSSGEPRAAKTRRQLPDGALISALVGAGVSLIVAGGLYYVWDRRNGRGARASGSVAAAPPASGPCRRPPVQFLAVLNPGEHAERELRDRMISIAKPLIPSAPRATTVESRGAN